MQGWFSISRSINLMYHSNNLKDKNHTVILTEAKKGIWQNSTPFHDKKHSTSWNRRECPQYNKGPLWKSTANITLHDERWDAFPVTSGTEQGCPLSPVIKFNSKKTPTKTKKLLITLAKPISWIYPYRKSWVTGFFTFLPLSLSLNSPRMRIGGVYLARISPHISLPQKWSR